jgi:hypothetical protein
MNDDFGNWFAGFVAGEGSFMLIPNNGHISARFNVSLRADDLGVLAVVQQDLGYGVLSVRPRRRDQTGDIASFDVQRIDDCMRIVFLFQSYPLRAKKQGEFDIWAEAVTFKKCNPVRCGGKDPSDAAVIHRKQVTATLLSFKERLAASRVYKETST